MSLDSLPAWLAYPNSKAVLRLGTNQAGRPELHVACNAEGLASLVGALLWLTSFSDHGSMSVSGLPFVRVEGALALSVIISMEAEKRDYGRIVRVDKEKQFEWRVDDEQLTSLAINLHRIATSPDYDNWLDVDVAQGSDAELCFEVESAES